SSDLSAAALDFTSAFSPELAVLGSPLGSREADLLAGQALQRVWLTARHFGLSIAVHLLTSHDARSGIRQLIGGGVVPQALLSIAPAAPIPTPRPSAEEAFSRSPRTAWPARREAAEGEQPESGRNGEDRTQPPAHRPTPPGEARWRASNRPASGCSTSELLVS